MNDTRTCPTCSIYRPDADPRLPNRPPVCDGDRSLLDRHLCDIANLIADLSNDEEPLVDDRRHERFGTAYFEGGLRHVFSRGLSPSDPLAVLGGVAPINSRSKAPSVSGSRERPIPIPVTSLDLKASARVPALSDWPQDQIGHLSAATILDLWVRAIRAAVFPGQHLPPATVGEMVSWLRNRLEDICDQYPAVPGFAEEICNLRSALRSAAGVTEPPPERCDGVACKRCDQITLYREPAGDVICVNADCQAVLRDDEYTDWVKTLAAEVRVRRHAQVNG